MYKPTEWARETDERVVSVFKLDPPGVTQADCDCLEAKLRYQRKDSLPFEWVTNGILLQPQVRIFIWCLGRRTGPMHVKLVTTVKGDISTLKGIPRLSFIYHDFCRLPHSTLAKIFWYPQSFEFKYCSIQVKSCYWNETEQRMPKTTPMHNTEKKGLPRITTIGKVKMFYFWKYML